MFDIDDLFASGGAPALKFPTVGTTHIGTITGLEARQQRDFEKNELVTWDNGEPKMELVVTMRDVDGNEGRLFAKAQMLSAIRDAVRVAGCKKPEIGGQLAVSYTHDGENKNPKFNPPKMYQVAYEPPAVAAAAAMFDSKTDTATPDPNTPLTAEQLAAMLSAS